MYVRLPRTCSYRLRDPLKPQTRTSARWATPVLTPATTSWAPTTARAPEASPSRLTAGRVKVGSAPPSNRRGGSRCSKVQCPLPPPPLDIDECSLDESACHHGQDCMNTIGSYRCVMRCGRGFRRTADGLSCAGASSVLRPSVAVEAAGLKKKQQKNKLLTRLRCVPQT